MSYVDTDNGVRNSHRCNYDVVRQQQQQRRDRIDCDQPHATINMNRNSHDNVGTEFRSYNNCGTEYYDDIHLNHYFINERIAHSFNVTNREKFRGPDENGEEGRGYYGDDRRSYGLQKTLKGMGNRCNDERYPISSSNQKPRMDIMDYPNKCPIQGYRKTYDDEEDFCAVSDGCYSTSRNNKYGRNSYSYDDAVYQENHMRHSQYHGKGDMEENFYEHTDGYGVSNSYAVVRENQGGEILIDREDWHPKDEADRGSFGLQKDDDLYYDSNEVKYVDVIERKYNDQGSGSVPFQSVQSIAPGSNGGTDEYSRKIERKMKEAEKESSSYGHGGMNKKTPVVEQAAMLEIEPGVYARLRTAQETMEAIERDFYVPNECFCCNLLIFCIQDADYVLCPECRVISRNGNSDANGSFGVHECKDKNFGGGYKDGGIGLGFTIDDLSEWQADVDRRRACSNTTSYRYG